MTELPLRACDFLICHPSGSDVPDLAKYLGYSGAFIRSCIVKHKIAAAKVARLGKQKGDKIWWIEADEVLRLLRLHHCWVTIAAAARLAKVGPIPLKKYVLRGCFGPREKSLTGEIVFQRTWLAGLHKRYHAIGRRNRDNGIARSHQLSEDDLSTEDIAGKLDVAIGVVCYWLEKKILDGTMCRGIWIIKQVAFDDFVAKVTAGQIYLRPSTREKIRQYQSRPH